VKKLLRENLLINIKKNIVKNFKRNVKFAHKNKKEKKLLNMIASNIL
jgi:hypothetical protein